MESQTEWSGTATELLLRLLLYDLAEAEKHCTGCGKDLRLIAEETSERYEYIPASMKVIQDVCLKYACDCTVRTATKPLQPIEKSTAGASLLAQVIVAKWADHQPLDRQEKMFERHGIDISRKTMGGWMAHCAELRSFVPVDEEGAVEFQGDWHRRYQREGAGPKTSLCQDRTDLAICGRCASSGDCVRLHAHATARRSGEVSGRIQRVSAGGRLLRL
jgi:transposase